MNDREPETEAFTRAALKEDETFTSISIRRLPPGSDEAIRQGCICPVLDNAHGRGYMGVAGQYVIHGQCRWHAMQSHKASR